jgi:hypothetical protein
MKNSILAIASSTNAVRPDGGTTSKLRGAGAILDAAPEDDSFNEG